MFKSGITLLLLITLGYFVKVRTLDFAKKLSNQTKTKRELELSKV